jgi:biopolymer transport protein ExbB/TolQ
MSLNFYSGKTYWSIQIDTYTLQQKTPKAEFTPLRRQLQADLKTALNNRTAYATEKAASAAIKKLPHDLQAVSYIAETTPIHGLF